MYYDTVGVGLGGICSQGPERLENQLTKRSNVIDFHTDGKGDFLCLEAIEDP